MKQGLFTIGKVLKTSTRNFFEDHGPFLASGLSFDLVLYCFPLPIIFVSALGYTVVGSEQAIAWMHDIIQGLLPDSQQLFLETLDSIMTNRRTLGLTGLIMFVLFSSAVFTSARHILSVIFQVETPSTFLIGKFVDLLLMIALTILLIVTALLSSGFSLIPSFGESFPVLKVLINPFEILLGKCVSFAFLTILFYGFYNFSATSRIAQSALWVGALSGAVLFELSQWAFSYYVSVAILMTSFYGALSGIVFFIIWIYYASVVFIFGAEVAWAYHRIRREGMNVAG